MNAIATGTPSAISASTPRLSKARALVQSMARLELTACASRLPRPVQHAPKAVRELDRHQCEHQRQRPERPPFRGVEFLDDASGGKGAGDDHPSPVPHEKERYGEAEDVSEDLAAPR